MAGLTDPQKLEVRAMIAEAVTTSLLAASDEAKTSIEQAAEKLRIGLVTFESNTIKQKEDHERVMTEIAQKQAQMQSIVQQLNDQSEGTRIELTTALTDIDRQMTSMRE